MAARFHSLHTPIHVASRLSRLAARWDPDRICDYVATGLVGIPLMDWDGSAMAGLAFLSLSPCLRYVSAGVCRSPLLRMVGNSVQSKWTLASCKQRVSRRSAGSFPDSLSNQQAAPAATRVSAAKRCLPCRQHSHTLLARKHNLACNRQSRGDLLLGFFVELHKQRKTLSWLPN